MIPYGRQEITEADIAAVVEVLRSDWLTQGPMVPRFEQAIASYCGARHAVAVNSATSALHIACLALDLGPGDWLWTSPNTFVASANCGLYCGANVDFVDIDPHTYNLCPEKLAEKLEQAERAGRLDPAFARLTARRRDRLERATGLLVAFSYQGVLERGFALVRDAAHAVQGSVAVARDVTQRVLREKAARTDTATDPVRVPAP